MGTLGCINDMMRRDKENRELRRASRERLNETRNRLLDVKGKRRSVMCRMSNWSILPMKPGNGKKRSATVFLKVNWFSSLCLQVLFY